MNRVSASAAAIQKTALLGDTGDTAPSLPPADTSVPRRFPAANSLLTAMALSFSGGYIDGFTYTSHGHVFASAMTGNMVLLGIRMASLNVEAIRYAVPISAYVTGVIIAHILLRDGIRRYLPIAPHVLTLLIEIVVLLSVAFAPLHLDDVVLVSIITIGTSMQNTSFRNIGTRTYNSVFMTGNLQGFSNALASGAYPFRPKMLAEARDLGGVLASFITGAALGALATSHIGAQAVVLPAALLSIGMFLLLAKRENRHGRVDSQS